jgi:inorganic phosphate transporter, PiT family
VFFGLLFDYTNGFHDAANVVATVIATRVLTPLCAICLAGLFNFIGGLQVSGIVETITSEIVQNASATPLVVLSGILGGIIWNIFTWYFGIPSSSSYALIGGIIGSSLVSGGIKSILWKGVFIKVVVPMIISPFLGLMFSYAMVKLLLFLLHKKIIQNEKIFSYLQLVSAGFVALSHGLNDAQKSMGIITLGLFSAHLIEVPIVPFWVVFTCALVMGLGTASGGMRITKTVGFSITKLKPMQGFAAESSASIVILLASILGMPISSTLMIVGGITGTGLAQKKDSVHWSTLRKIAWIWVFALPGAALSSALFFLGIRFLM